MNTFHYSEKQEQPRVALRKRLIRRALIGGAILTGLYGGDWLRQNFQKEVARASAINATLKAPEAHLKALSYLKINRLLWPASKQEILTSDQFCFVHEKSPQELGYLGIESEEQKHLIEQYILDTAIKTDSKDQPHIYLNEKVLQEGLRIYLTFRGERYTPELQAKYRNLVEDAAYYFEQYFPVDSAFVEDPEEANIRMIFVSEAELTNLRHSGKAAIAFTEDAYLHLDAAGQRLPSIEFNRPADIFMSDEMLGKSAEDAEYAINENLSNRAKRRDPEVDRIELAASGKAIRTRLKELALLKTSIHEMTHALGLGPHLHCGNEPEKQFFSFFCHEDRLSTFLTEETLERMFPLVSEDKEAHIVRFAQRREMPTARRVLDPLDPMAALLRVAVEHYRPGTN